MRWTLIIEYEKKPAAATIAAIVNDLSPNLRALISADVPKSTQWRIYGTDSAASMAGLLGKAIVSGMVDHGHSVASYTVYS